MLTEEPFMIVFEKTPKTLISLELSKNEHLTPKCFSFLHNFPSLAHLSVENCNIGDETIAILLNLDPLKVNNNGNMVGGENGETFSLVSTLPKKMLKKKSSMGL